MIKMKYSWVCISYTAHIYDARPTSVIHILGRPQSGILANYKVTMRIFILWLPSAYNGFNLNKYFGIQKFHALRLDKGLPFTNRAKVFYFKQVLTVYISKPWYCPNMHLDVTRNLTKIKAYKSFTMHTLWRMTIVNLGLIYGTIFEK